ncbi:MAG TPA: hypothetical protein VHP11_16030 [Tepidisphaeraceae bacterium]|nr:hypothetical protein [Tepidisphaeraceae bacterium]
MGPVTKTMAGVLTLLLGAAVAQGMWMKVDESVPGERLMANIQRFIEQHPQDPQSYYVLEQLIDPQAQVRFDLAGNGSGRLWPWVKPQTGILVWDPQRTGQVTSGRQLFGSVTWWMFWSSGYEALAALDDDGDGFLRGRELEGLAVWRDAGSDAQSGPGEVVPVPVLGIERIAVHATQTQNGSGYSPEGIWMRDGRHLPTYDWTPIGQTQVVP